MVIAEIVPAFKGIADKLVKDAKPALDCPTVFPFAPNAVIVGFLASFVAGFGQHVSLPAVRLERHRRARFPTFLRGHSGGLRQHYRRTSRGGGRGFCSRSAHFVPACHSLAHDGDMGLGSTTFGDADFGVVGIVLGHIIAMFN